MGLKSINEPEVVGRTTMLYPISINEPPQLPEGVEPPIEPEPPIGEVPNPSLNSINPSTAKEDAGQISFNATGTRFYAGSKISFGGEFIPTIFVNEGKLTGTFETTTYGEGSYLVHVDNENSLSENKTFTLTAASETDLRDPDEMEEAIEEEQDDEFKPLHASHRPKR